MTSQFHCIHDLRISSNGSHIFVVFRSHDPTTMQDYAMTMQSCRWTKTESNRLLDQVSSNFHKLAIFGIFIGKTLCISPYSWKKQTNAANEAETNKQFFQCVASKESDHTIRRTGLSENSPPKSNPSVVYFSEVLVRSRPTLTINQQGLKHKHSGHVSILVRNFSYFNIKQKYLLKRMKMQLGFSKKKS